MFILTYVLIVVQEKEVSKQKQYNRALENINLSFLNIEADELMKILVYIAYKSKMSKLFVLKNKIKYIIMDTLLTSMATL